MKEIIKFLADDGILYSTREKAVEADYCFHKKELEKYEALWSSEVKRLLCERMQDQAVAGSVKGAGIRIVSQGDATTKINCTVQLEFSTSIVVKDENMDHGVNLVRFSNCIVTNIMSKIATD